jgi:hypothetical protein
MASVDFSAHNVHPTIIAPDVAPGAAAPPTRPDAAASSDDSGYSFDDLLDVVNPLQHIPVVSTLYRAITGDTIKTLPKIAGDTLYGGLTGFAGSVADSIFEKITGKSVGDTVLAYAEELFSPGDPTDLKADGAPRVASVNLPALPAPSVPAADPTGTDSIAAASNAMPNAGDAVMVPGQDALLLALNRKDIDQNVALRAASAYRRMVSAPADLGGLHGSLN